MDTFYTKRPAGGSHRRAFLRSGYGNGQQDAKVHGPPLFHPRHLNQPYLLLWFATQLMRNTFDRRGLNKALFKERRFYVRLRHGSDSMSVLRSSRVSISETIKQAVYESGLTVDTLAARVGLPADELQNFLGEDSPF